MRYALDKGVNLIDTAECYGDHCSEALLGDHLAHLSDFEPIDVTEGALQARVAQLRVGVVVGEVALFNVWATWCVACRSEHPVLMQLAESGKVAIYGLNYKDDRAEAKRWLLRYGDPYLANAFDADGRVGIDWGVYGTPETFIVDQQGVIRHKHIGPLTQEVVRDEILPLVEKLEATSG